MASFPNPRLMSFQEWTGYVILEIAPGRALGYPEPGSDWREWATQVKRSEVFGPLTPSPEFYKTWVDWAEAVTFAGVT